jgi:RNA polymerase sigma factor (sigma-70 family)
MSHQSLERVLRRLQTAAAVQANRRLPDGELLARFVESNDEAAFAVLVERHGPMVLGVCRRLLAGLHDAEDACQATFLVLARKAASVRRRTSLGSWLHGVARRVAINLKRDQARRRDREQGRTLPPPADPAAEVSWREAQAILDEELQRLPERYRPPLILCYLECLTRDEAARQLGLAPGTLHGRLQRGRDLLRRRLTQRGLALAGLMSATALGEGSALAAPASTFVVSSARAAALLAAGQSVPGNVVSARVLILTQEAMKRMFLTKCKMVATAVLCAGALVALFGGVFAASGHAQDDRQVLGQWLGSQGAPNQESDEAFLRRMSKELRGNEPTPAEVHFFLASKDPGKRQRVIDLFIQERQARQKAESLKERLDLNEDRERLIFKVTVRMGVRGILLDQPPTLESLQKQFYDELLAAKANGDVAQITQAYLDRLTQYVKDHPKNEDAPQAVRQIIQVYEAQGKQVEAGAWREKLQKEYPKAGGVGPAQR